QPNAPRQVGWLLKVDSNGCEIENCVVGIDDIESSQLLKVYPNPATDRLMIELPESNESNKVYINSITGESIAVVDVPLGATQVEVNTANFAVGVYLARINNQTRKFIIVN
ncbi:MAG: T9SS type A sorting domain-containing protein, partial [Bacteroidetes bacterium]|nr:T9SS type A sorting domain-containing protein [Bacteroidota bacterium]